MESEMTGRSLHHSTSGSIGLQSKGVDPSMIGVVCWTSCQKASWTLVLMICALFAIQFANLIVEDSVSSVTGPLERCRRLRPVPT